MLGWRLRREVTFQPHMEVASRPHMEVTSRPPFEVGRLYSPDVVISEKSINTDIISTILFKNLSDLA